MDTLITLTDYLDQQHFYNDALEELANPVVEDFGDRTIICFPFINRL